MSEYQYYEFRAIDKPLTRKDQEHLRDISSRGTITSSSFVNEYEWGDFKGNPLKLMHRCFDLHVYYANWGSQQLLLKVPKAALQGIEVDRYKCNALSFDYVGDQVVVEFDNPTGEPDDDFDVYNRSWADDLLPIRDLLLSGDERPLYLAWLASADSSSNKPGPPVPAGLKDAPEELDALCEFLGVDGDLQVAAGTFSPSIAAKEATKGQATDLIAWVKGLDSPAKDSLLLRLFEGDGVAARAEMQSALRTYQRGIARAAATTNATRAGPSGKELWIAANDQLAIRQAEKAETSRLAKEAAAYKAAEARNVLLRERYQQFEKIWQQVETHIKAGATQYQSAVTLLVDLRDATSKHGRSTEFESRLTTLNATYQTRSALMKRLRDASLARIS